MQVDLEPTGPDEGAVRSLQDWLRRERIAGMRVAPVAEPPGPEHMGADMVAALSVVLGSAAVVELVRSLHVWLRSRVPTVGVTIRMEGTEIVLDGRNLPDVERMVQGLAEAARPRSGSEPAQESEA
jgi:hypothetical protein